MPGMTPNFNIRYPCAGETIDPQVFEDFAEDVEAALVSVDAAADAALLRPRGALRTVPTGISTTVAVTTAMAYNVTDFADGVTVIAGGFTIITPGVYMVDCEFSPITVVTTVTSFTGDITQNATVVYRRKLGWAGVVDSAGPINISGLVSCAAADTIQANWRWTGTGGPMFVYSRISISKICDV